MRPLVIVLIRHQKLYVISVTADLCGLTLVFTSIALPEHLKTVYIPQLTFCWPVRIKSRTDQYRAIINIHTKAAHHVFQSKVLDLCHCRITVWG